MRGRGRPHERADDQVGHRRAQARDVVVTRPRRVVRSARARTARDIVKVLRVLVEDTHHLLWARAVKCAAGRLKHGPGRQSPGAPTTAAPRHWCLPPRASRKLFRCRRRNHRRRIRWKATHHRPRRRWLVPMTSASPLRSDTTVVTRTCWGPRRCHSSQPRSTSRYWSSRLTPFHRWTKRSATPTAMRPVRRRRPLTPRTTTPDSSKSLSYVVSPENSPAPQLIETTFA